MVIKIKHFSNENLNPNQIFRDGIKALKSIDFIILFQNGRNQDIESNNIESNNPEVTPSIVFMKRSTNNRGYRHNCENGAERKQRRATKLSIILFKFYMNQNSF